MLDRRIDIRGESEQGEDVVLEGREGGEMAQSEVRRARHPASYRHISGSTVAIAPPQLPLQLLPKTVAAATNPCIFMQTSVRRDVHSPAIRVVMHAMIGR